MKRLLVKPQTKEQLKVLKKIFKEMGIATFIAPGDLLDEVEEKPAQGKASGETFYDWKEAKRKLKSK
jgi:hypothetical protein